MANWGILGTGRIAQKFARAVATSQREQVLGIASRSVAQAQRAAQELGISRAYGSYSELLADPEIELIYVALPNNMHSKWSTKAALQGKQVLCEKPLAADEAEAKQMFQVAKEQGTRLMEGFVYRFHPQTHKLQQLLAAKEIGELRLVRIAFGITIDDPTNIRLSPELGGGALGDVGCYCVSMARMVVGSPPTRVQASAVWAASGVDETLVATLEYANGVTAQISCSLNTARHQSVQLIGSEGIIEVETPFSILPDQPARLRVGRGARSPAYETITIEPADQFRLEAEGFAALVAAKPDEQGLYEMPMLESVENAATLAALLRSARAEQR